MVAFADRNAERGRIPSFNDSCVSNTRLLLCWAGKTGVACRAGDTRADIPRMRWMGLQTAQPFVANKKKYHVQVWRALMDMNYGDFKVLECGCG